MHTVVNILWAAAKNRTHQIVSCIYSEQIDKQAREEKNGDLH